MRSGKALSGVATRMIEGQEMEDPIWANDNLAQHKVLLKNDVDIMMGLLLGETAQGFEGKGSLSGILMGSEGFLVMKN